MAYIMYMYIVYKYIRPRSASAHREYCATLPVLGVIHYPEGSLCSDCEAGMPQLEALSLDRSAWRDKVSSLT